MTEPTLVFNEESRVDDPQALRFLLRSIFPEETVQQVDQLVATLSQHANVLQSPACVAETMRASLSQLLASSGHDRVANLRMLGQIAQHEVMTSENRAAYVPASKFNPDAVWYPNPTRFPHPTSVHDTLPYAKLAKLVDRTTPVTSAGSCFATEISHHLQANGFNYVITEPHYHAGSPYSMASAAWGTIFNVPAMRQLVEKAFELRKLPRLLWRMEDKGRTVYRDPFREEVEFASVAEYEANYPVHVEACRRALLEAEVFVITLGLTEIWQLKSDGSVLSRVPWRLSSSLVERRMLSVEENLAELELMLGTLRRFNPRVQFIVTVSPVPLQATYRGDEAHVVVASSLSKCTLRVAAEQFAKRNSGVTYFPAFETVMYCTEQPFERDHRHVRRSTVARVMRLFHTMFVRDSGFAACQLASELREREGEVRFLLHPDWRGD
ncbi:MAG TPA: GSCFA domain-containing protein, partial [Planctomycetota bacterium]|nr:GSCFA domain-containing protein [Planctomycetota bacterium]